VPERDPPARRPGRAAVVDQHLHLGDQEHVADVRDRLRRADDDRDPHQQPDAADDGSAHGARDRLPDARLEPVDRDPPGRAAPGDRGGALMPDWSGPVWHYILHEGLPNTLRVAAIALVASTLIGVVMGTLLTIAFRPSRILIRGYVEIFRGLPILV